MTNPLITLITLTTLITEARQAEADGRAWSAVYALERAEALNNSSAENWLSWGGHDHMPPMITYTDKVDVSTYSLVGRKEFTAFAHEINWDTVTDYRVHQEPPSTDARISALEAENKVMREALESAYELLRQPMAVTAWAGSEVCPLDDAIILIRAALNQTQGEK